MKDTRVFWMLVVMGVAAGIMEYGFGWDVQACAYCIGGAVGFCIGAIATGGKL